MSTDPTPELEWVDFDDDFEEFARSGMCSLVTLSALYAQLG